jgi:hypothetical protein
MILINIFSYSKWKKKIIIKIEVELIKENKIINPQGYIKINYKIY